MTRWMLATVAFLVAAALPGLAAAQSSESLPEPKPPDEESSDEKAGESERPPPRPDRSGEASGDSDNREGRDRRGGAECVYHDDCPARHLCHGGRCVRRSKFTEYESADEACGNDRRCRLDRLKRRNRARRRMEMLDRERQLQELIDEYRAKRIEDYPRLERAFSVDLRASRLGVLGISAGYTLLGRIRPELQLAYNGDYRVSQSNEEQRFSGTQQVGYIMPGLIYFFLTSDFSPYAGLSFLYGTGTYNGFDGPAADAELETEYHALSVKAGVDFQLGGSGFHARAGLGYRHLIYNQARRGPGRYVEPTKVALEDWFNELARIDVLVLVGWAF